MQPRRLPHGDAARGNWMDRPGRSKSPFITPSPSPQRIRDAVRVKLKKATDRLYVSVFRRLEASLRQLGVFGAHARRQQSGTPGSRLCEIAWIDIEAPQKARVVAGLTEFNARCVCLDQLLIGIGVRNITDRIPDCRGRPSAG